MKKRWNIAAAVLAAASLLGPVRGAAAQSDGDPVTIRLADQSSFGEITFHYAEYTGILQEAFKDYNVEFDISDFGSGAAENEAFAANALDFACMGNMPSFTGTANDYGYKVLAVEGCSEYGGSVVAAADSGITSLEELKGKTFGTFIGGALHYYAGLYLASAGLTLDDVQLINTQAETATGIRSGELDAGILATAAAQQLENEGSGTILADKCGTITFASVCGSEKFTEEYPEYTEILLKVVKDTLEYADANQEDYFSYFEERTGMDSTTTRDTWEYSEHTAKVPDEEVLKASEDLLKWMQDNGLLENTEVTIDELFDLSYAENAGL